MPHIDSDLWACPKCGQKLAAKNMWHSCGHYRMEDLFARSEPHVGATYKLFEAAALEIAPFHIIPQKTRFCYQLRMRCINGTAAKSHLRIGLVLPRIVEHQRFEKVETFSPVIHLHTLKLFSPADVDEQLRDWLSLSTVCGEQRHLSR